MTWACACGAASQDKNRPDDLRLPCLIVDMNFNDQTIGQAPHPDDKQQLETIAQSPWKALPLKTYTQLDHITRGKTATVLASALGLNDQPVLFDCPDNRQPNWGPRMSINIPRAMIAVGHQYRVRFDVSLGTVTKMGGISLGNHVGDIRFFEDGTVRLGSTEIVRYAPSQPLHFDCLIDNDNHQIKVQVDKNEALDIPWQQPTARSGFTGIRLDGLLPGGHARVGSIAFDNVKITLEK